MGSDNESSDTDLHVAVRYCDINRVKDALKENLSPNKIGLYEWSPLHEAASCGYEEIVKLLLDNGGDPNLPDRLGDNTPVHYAAMGDNAECLQCLIMLLAAGGDYTKRNNEQMSALDIASELCRPAIEKKRVEALLRMTLGEARTDAQMIDSRKQEKTTHIPAIVYPKNDPITDEMLLSSLALTSSLSSKPRAWIDKSTESEQGTLGRLHLSFEYNSKKGNLKIRLWKYADVLVPPAGISMISTLYVKSYLMPDSHKETRRRSEEIRVAPLLQSAGRRKTVQPYVTEGGQEVIYQPITFKFSKPLEYLNITKEMVETRTVALQVCLTHKYSMKTYVIGDVHVLLSIAVRKIVREAFPVSMRSMQDFPQSMTVFPNMKNCSAESASDPNIRHDSNLSVPCQMDRPSSDTDLREVATLSSFGSQSPSVSIEIPTDEDETQGELNEVKVIEPPTQHTVRVMLPGAIDESSSNDDIRILNAREMGKLFSNVKVWDGMQQQPPAHASAERLNEHHVTISSSEDSESELDIGLKPNHGSLFHLQGRKSSSKVSLLEAGKAPKSHHSSPNGLANEVFEMCEVPSDRGAGQGPFCGQSPLTGPVHGYPAPIHRKTLRPGTNRRSRRRGGGQADPPGAADRRVSVCLELADMSAGDGAEQFQV